MLFLWHLGENFILIHLVLRALARNVFRDPRQPPSLCGSHLVVGDFTGTFPPQKCPSSYHLYPSLDVFVFQIILYLNYGSS